MTTPTLRDRIDGIILPGYLLFYAVRSYAAVLFETLIQRNRPFSEVRDEAFARFWNFISAPPPPGQPLLGSAALIPPLIATASGVVLEVGPGSGAQVQYFAPAAKNITRIYGAEPCLHLHPTLLAAAAKTAGLIDKYTIIPCSGDRDSLIPGLAKAGLLDPNRKHTGNESEHSDDDDDDDGIFNTILCVRVLCSVTDLSSTCETLHHLLKRGGRLIVVEHEVNPGFSSLSLSSSSLSSSSSQSHTAPQGSLLARLVQVLYTLMGWSYFVGNCHLQRDIEGALIAAGEWVEGGRKGSGWEKIELKKSFGWAVLPYVSGVLVKRR